MYEYTHNKVAECPHGEQLHILAPHRTVVNELRFAFPCGCGLTASGVIRTEAEQKPEPRVIAPVGIFDRKTRQVDWDTKKPRLSGAF